MFNFDHIVRTASAAVCSLLLTTVAVGAAVTPFPAGAETAPVYASANGDSAHG